MNQAAIAQAMANGAPITCATCRHFHEGNSRCGQTECGGPGLGRDFPDYDGPIPRDKFVDRCLVCGASEVAFHVILSTDKTKYSLCHKHRKVYDYVGTPEGRIKHLVTLIAVV